MLKGIQFVVDDSGKKTAVIINFEEWGELWEDIYDILISESRRNEPTVPWEALKTDLGEEDKPANNV
jgi:hypothetical protein